MFKIRPMTEWIKERLEERESSEFCKREEERAVDEKRLIVAKEAKDAKQRHLALLMEKCDSLGVKDSLDDINNYYWRGSATIIQIKDQRESVHRAGAQTRSGFVYSGNSYAVSEYISGYSLVYEYKQRWANGDVYTYFDGIALAIKDKSTSQYGKKRLVQFEDFEKVPIDNSVSSLLHFSNSGPYSSDTTEIHSWPNDITMEALADRIKDWLIYFSEVRKNKDRLPPKLLEIEGAYR
jgi:hypothetical protein